MLGFADALSSTDRQGLWPHGRPAVYECLIGYALLGIRPLQSLVIQRCYMGCARVTVLKRPLRKALHPLAQAC